MAEIRQAHSKHQRAVVSPFLSYLFTGFQPSRWYQDLSHPNHGLIRSFAPQVTCREPFYTGSQSAYASCPIVSWVGMEGVWCWDLRSCAIDILQETKIFPSKGFKRYFWVHDFPCPQVWYVSSLGGVGFFSWCVGENLQCLEFFRDWGLETWRIGILRSLGIYGKMFCH